MQSIDRSTPQSILHSNHPITTITLGHKVYISLTDTESDCARHPANDMLASTDFSTLGKYSVKTQRLTSDFDCILCLKQNHPPEKIKQLPNGENCISMNCGHYQAGTAKLRSDCMICKYQTRIDKIKSTEYPQIVLHKQNIFLSGNHLLISYCEDCDKLYYITHSLLTSSAKIIKDITSCALGHRSNDFSVMYGLNLRSTIRLVYEVMFESSAADIFSIKSRYWVDAYNKRVRVAVVHPMFNNNILELQGLCAAENITLITLGLDTVYYYEMIRDIHLALDRRGMTSEPLNAEIMEHYQREFLEYYHNGEFIIYKPHSIFIKDPPPDGFSRAKVSKYLDQEFAGKAPAIVKNVIPHANSSTNDFEEIVFVPDVPAKNEKIPTLEPPLTKETKLEKIKQLIKKSPETSEQRWAAEIKKMDEANVLALTKQFKLEKEKNEPPLLNLEMDSVEDRPVKKYIPDDLVLDIEPVETTNFTVDMEKMVDELVTGT